jgi:hypothetical protein
MNLSVMSRGTVATVLFPGVRPSFRGATKTKSVHGAEHPDVELPQDKEGVDAAGNAVQ